MTVDQPEPDQDRNGEPELPPDGNGEDHDTVNPRVVRDAASIFVQRFGKDLLGIPDLVALVEQDAPKTEIDALARFVSADPRFDQTADLLWQSLKAMEADEDLRRAERGAEHKAVGSIANLAITLTQNDDGTRPVGLVETFAIAVAGPAGIAVFALLVIAIKLRKFRRETDGDTTRISIDFYDLAPKTVETLSKLVDPVTSAIIAASAKDDGDDGEKE